MGLRISSSWRVWLCLGQIASSVLSFGCWCNSQAIFLVLIKRHRSSWPTSIIGEGEMYQLGICSAKEKERDKQREGVGEGERRKE